MPGFNGTGPKGAGPMTGRGLGNCGNGAYSQGISRGLGRGFGQGRGWRRWLGFGNRQLANTEETADVKTYIEDLKAELTEAEKYLKNLGDKK